MTILHTPIGQFDLVTWAGRNTSGIQPFGDRVLILPDQASARINGVFVPAETIERIAEAAETGVLVAVGEGAWAWNGDRSRRYEGIKPTPGTRVYFERYAGGKFHGQDGLVYRLMDDKSVGGFAVEPEGEAVEQAAPAAHVSEAHALQDIIARGHTLEAELVDLDQVEAPVAAEAPDTKPTPKTPPPDLEVAVQQSAAPRFPVYLTRAGVLMMAFNAADMEAKGAGQHWYTSAEEANRAYAESNEAHVAELVRTIKAS